MIGIVVFVFYMAYSVQFHNSSVLNFVNSNSHILYGWYCWSTILLVLISLIAMFISVICKSLRFMVIAIRSLINTVFSAPLMILGSFCLDRLASQKHTEYSSVSMDSVVIIVLCLSLGVLFSTAGDIRSRMLLINEDIKKLK